MTYQEDLGELGRIYDTRLAALTGELAATQEALRLLDVDLSTLRGERDALTEQLRVCRGRVRKLLGVGDHAYDLLVGMSPGPANNETNMQIADDRAGRILDCRRSFDTTLDSSFAQSAAGSDVGRRASVWSFKQNASLEAITAFLNTVPTDHQLFVIYWHEPEDDFIGQAAEGDFVARNRKVREAVDAANVNRALMPIQFWGCTMAYMTDRWSRFAEPCVQLWDGVAFDGYAWGKDDTMRPASSIFGDDFARARELGFEQVGVAEFGNQWGVLDFGGPGVDISAWVSDALTYFREQRVVFASYFNPHETLTRDSEFLALGAQP